MVRLLRFVKSGRDTSQGRGFEGLVEDCGGFSALGYPILTMFLWERIFLASSSDEGSSTDRDDFAGACLCFVEVAEFGEVVSSEGEF